MQIFEVGGCIRDEFLGLQSKDIDFTYVSSNRDSIEDAFSEMVEWMNSEGFEIFLSTPEMVTVRAKFPKQSTRKNLVADFVLARKELGYTQDSRRPIVVPGSLEDDLARRDFTCNAIAKSLDGEIIDPFNGIQAIKDKVLITPLDPLITFQDDPLRVLRAFRFSITKGFSIEKRTELAMLNGEVWQKFEKVVSGERVREELTKCFKHDTVKTMSDLLHYFDMKIPFESGINPIQTIFSKGLWLMPTFKEI